MYYSKCTIYFLSDSSNDIKAQEDGTLIKPTDVINIQSLSSNNPFTMQGVLVITDIDGRPHIVFKQILPSDSTEMQWGLDYIVSRPQKLLHFNYLKKLLTYFKAIIN